ncbi:beta-ketoacyl synthase N-terminal-like domain-containing protein, partial [Streptomyces sp. NPDC095817]|uniref:type I polyketide synthase n=1 Tax=Streptomyces sp. NPDC095817 TaxID=3155082 RepID=UPI00333147A4
MWSKVSGGQYRLRQYLHTFDVRVCGENARLRKSQCNDKQRILRLSHVSNGSGSAGSAYESWRKKLIQESGLGQQRLLLDFIRRHVASESFQRLLSFRQMGITRSKATRLREKIAVEFGMEIPATILFDYPNPTALAQYLVDRIVGTSLQEGVASASSGKYPDSVQEPIAIIGMACRLPGGVASPDDLWNIVRDGVDAVGRFPEDRGWDVDLYDPDPAKSGKIATREGGFLVDVASFDAEFFGISPREVLGMDPQQRLLLETSWESFESARIDPLMMRGSKTGVFAGVAYEDYQRDWQKPSPRAEGYVLTGTLSSVASGRIAYTLGLEGPAITVDTACSSGLVALHLAAQSLRQGECSLALVGGATIMSDPGVFVEFSRKRGLAPDGRCKSFSADADGTGWGEGVATVLLERLSDAQRLGHEVLAVVRGSAVNSDGASNGLTAPNGPAQQRVIRDALRNAGLSTADVDLVEAHGTGTPLGDPIEAQALIDTYGRERRDKRPLRLGSLKSNIGHTQAAAGIAGLIKTVMAFRHELMPRTLHISEPSPHVRWATDKIQLLSEAVPWPRQDDTPRRAGISAFGLSGTNAHVVVEEPAATADASATDQGSQAPVICIVSGRSEEALRDQSAKLAAYVKTHPKLRLADLGLSLATTRSAFRHRAALVVNERDELVHGLVELSRSGTVAPTVGGVAAQERRTAFLFSGQGSQRPGTGRQLYEHIPAFRTELDEVCGAFAPGLDRPLKEVLFASETELLDRTEYTQPALFALEVALFRLLERWGITPDFVAGHSVGELVAAHVAGVLSLPDAAKLVTARARLMQALPSGGAMLAVQATEEEVSSALIGREHQVSIAAFNGPRSLVLSGSGHVLQGIADELPGRCRYLKVSHAFHSPLVEPMLADFRRVIGTLEFRQPNITLVSNVTGRVTDVSSPDYWVCHARQAVRFSDSVQWLHAQEVTDFVEVGPGNTLAILAEACLPEEAAPAVSVLSRNGTETETLLSAVAELHVRGVDVHWPGLFPGARPIPLPTSAFQRERYWLRTSSRTAADPQSMALGVGLVGVDHWLLGAVVESPGSGGVVLTGRVGVGVQSWLVDHVVSGVVVVPGAALVELALKGAELVGAWGVEELVIQAPMVLPATGVLLVQVVVGDAGAGGSRRVEVFARPDVPGAEWVSHAVGLLCADQAGVVGEFVGGVWPPVGARPVELGGFYEELASRGYEYGPLFRAVRSVWRDGEEVFADLVLDDVLETGGFVIHPVLLDAALHTVGFSGAGSFGDGLVRLPFAWQGVSVHAGGAARVRVRVSPTVAGDGVRLVMEDPAGGPVLVLESLTTRPVPVADLEALSAAAGSSVEDAHSYTLEWEP